MSIKNAPKYIAFSFLPGSSWHCDLKIRRHLLLKRSLLLADLLNDAPETREGRPCSRSVGRSLLRRGHIWSAQQPGKERERDSFSSRAAFPKFKLKCWPLQFQFSLSDAREGGSTDRRADRPTERERAVLVHCHIIYERGERREPFCFPYFEYL